MKKLTMKKANAIYEKYGASAVYELALKRKIPFSDCAPCEASTPTINKQCAICGQYKPTL